MGSFLVHRSMIGFCMFVYLVSSNLAELNFSWNYFCRFLGIFYVDNHVIRKEGLLYFSLSDVLMWMDVQL